jgi:hypothetical protein
MSTDVAVTYTASRGNVAANNGDSFWMQGGSADAALTFFHGLGAAVNLTGQHATNIAPGIDLNRLSFLAGPRYTYSTARWTDRYLGTKHATRIFGEALFGAVHGFNGRFPSATGLQSSADAFAMQLGGGADVAIARGFGVRALELDYVRSSLPNGGGDTQNDFRLAVGVSYHLQRR